MASFLEQQMNEASLLMEGSVNEASVIPIVASKSSAPVCDRDPEEHTKEHNTDKVKEDTDRALEVTSFLEKQINEASELLEDQNNDVNQMTQQEPNHPDEKVQGKDATGDDAAVRDLADRLAPSMEELDALLNRKESIRSLETSRNNKNAAVDASKDDDENSFDSELEHLAASEHILRQELEFAHDFGAMLNPSGDAESQSLSESEGGELNEAVLDSDNIDGEIFHPIDGEEMKNNAEEERKECDVSTGSKSTSVTRHNYTLSDHSHYLQIQTEARGGWYHRPISFDALAGREYIIPIPEQELDRLYVGLQPTSLSSPSSFPVPAVNTKNKKAATQQDSLSTESIAVERLPIRVLGFKLRPDVLVGTVMDAIHHALKDDPYNLDVKKRQGGHLILQSQVLEFDFQIASYKGSGSRFCERTMLVRVFYLNHDQIRAPPPTDSHFMLAIGDAGDIQDLLDNESNWTLREASALVQKMETSKKGSSEQFFNSPFWVKKPVFPNKKAMQDAIARHLLEKFKPCPSVGSSNLTLPCLSKEDWPWIQYSYRYLKATWDELDDRDLTYSSLRCSPFGQFPSLTTLDVHYCSQLRRISRENMVLSLLRSASDLEQYAREAELTCANLIEVLKTCYDNYKLEPPKLPQALPLVAYPLEFTPHQETCPPWGQKVTEALNEITKLSSTSEEQDSFKRAEQGVQLVLDAFQIQHDEEQSARLGRKNVQVMDRLAKMQAHKLASIEKLQKSYNRSPTAQKAADEFHALASKSKFGSDPLPDLPASAHVPLFKCSVLVRGSTGSFYVTANHILCSTQLVPLVGGSRIKLLELKGLAFSVQGNQSSTSILNPLPAGLVVRRDGEEVLTFRPSYAASRLKVFLEIIQGFSINATKKLEIQNDKEYHGKGQDKTNESVKNEEEEKDEYLQEDEMQDKQGNKVEEDQISEGNDVTKEEKVETGEKNEKNSEPDLTINKEQDTQEEKGEFTEEEKKNHSSDGPGKDETQNEEGT